MLCSTLPAQFLRSAAPPAGSCTQIFQTATVDAAGNRDRRVQVEMPREGRVLIGLGAAAAMALRQLRVLVETMPRDRRVLISLGVATALSVRQLLKIQSARARRARLKGLTKLELLPIERGAMIHTCPGIGTITFFTGSPAAAEEYLARRVAEMTAANPWLCAVLDHDPDTGVMAAYYPQEGAPRAPVFAVRRDLPLRRGMPYAAMERMLAPVTCGSGMEAVGAGSPLFRVTLLPDASAPDRAFAVVVSANHTLLDGHGYYKMYNMLSADVRVMSMQPVRKQDLPAKILEAMGGTPSIATACPPGYLARILSGKLRSALFPQTKYCGFDISAEWLAGQKESAVRAGEVAFVSTNDCVTSGFFNCLQPNIGIMLINFRGRIAGCDDDDMGNYEEFLMYLKDDYATPALLRKSVSGPPYHRAADPPTAMLSNWEHVRGATYSTVTNWSTFARPLALGGAKQEMHLPLADGGQAAPPGFSVCILFQPAAGRVAALVFGKQELLDRVRASGMCGTPLDL